jgi:DNA polymerase III epsilon subunit-like protein
MQIIHAAIDLETTGLNKRNDEIIEIAVIPYKIEKNISIPITKFKSYIRPLKGLHPEAEKINKITLDKIINAPTPMQVKGSFLEWKENLFSDSQFELLGHNIGTFDCVFLENFFGTELYQKHFSYRISDTYTLSNALKRAGLIPENIDSGLKSLLKYFEISDNVPHKAYEDALLALQLYDTMIKLIKK